MLLSASGSPAPPPPTASSSLLEALLLPHQHPLSLRVAAQAAAFSLSRPAGVLAWVVVSPGLVDLTLQAADPTAGYGTRTWRFRVGGAGLGDAPHVAAMFGDDPRAPLAARFAE